ncbi:uncharacterized HhH-GPD family protein [Frankineae bacterium MT45]|nr:uncharacterized HhH-GPD family protein [Frankineae bacterium MT45]
MQPSSQSPAGRLSADIVLVGCARQKQQRPSRASDLYTSDAYRKRRLIATAVAPRWFILSAEHGLVEPNEWLAPYDLYLGDTSMEYRSAWGNWCVARLHAKVGDLHGISVLVLAPAAYANAIRSPLREAGATSSEPLAGLRQGEQASWLSREVAALAGRGAPLQPSEPALPPSGDIAGRGPSELSRDQSICEALLKYRERNQHLHDTRLGYSDSAEADSLLVDDPFAYLLGVLLDEGIPAERAWTGPYLLKQRLGHLDPYRLRHEASAVRAAVDQTPKIHRYIDVMSNAIVLAADRVCVTFDGDASRIWAPGSTAEQVDARFQQFHKIGPKKAAMAVELLISHFGIKLADHAGTNVAYDVHVRRVFLRAGLVNHDSFAEITEAARRLNPDRPGLLDLPTWLVGRRWCKAQLPDCGNCPISTECRKLTDRNVGQAPQ